MKTTPLLDLAPVLRRPFGVFTTAQPAGGERVVISHLAAAHLHGLQYTGTAKRPALELSIRRGA